MLTPLDRVLDALDELERLRPHRAELDALRARRDRAGWHPVSDAELLRMIELGVGEPTNYQGDPMLADPELAYEPDDYKRPSYLDGILDCVD